MLFMLKYQRRHSHLNQTKQLKIPSWNLVKGLRQRGHFLSSDSMSFKAHCLHTAECPQGSRTLVGRSSMSRACRALPSRGEDFSPNQTLASLWEVIGKLFMHPHIPTYIHTQRDTWIERYMYLYSIYVCPSTYLSVCMYLPTHVIHTHSTDIQLLKYRAFLTFGKYSDMRG